MHSRNVVHFSGGLATGARPHHATIIPPALRIRRASAKPALTPPYTSRPLTPARRAARPCSTPQRNMDIVTTAPVEPMESTVSASAVGPSGVKAQRIPNIRDLAEAAPATIQPARVLRCANPAGASDADVDMLMNRFHVRDLVDLRSGEELQEDSQHGGLFRRAARLIRYTRGWGSRIALDAEAEALRRQGPLIHHNVSLLERNRYLAALTRHIPLRAVLWAGGLRLLAQRRASREALIREINNGGLGLLYKILADSARPEILAVLRLISSALERGRGVLLFCKVGKDRTGLIAALLLHCAGATPDQIIEDYHRSDAYHQMALAGIEKREELRGLDRQVFERAPREAMAELLQYLQQQHGSISHYLAAVGFSAAEQARLRVLLTQANLP